MAKFSVRNFIVGWVVRSEYAIILFIFLVLRFVFKNIPDLFEYFTAQPVFNLSGKSSIAVGSFVLLAVIAMLSSWFGKLIRINGTDSEKPLLYFIALFFACPASLPFLFNYFSASGSLLLYPFALFIFSVFIAGKPVIKWFLPLICTAYFIPAAYSTEVFFLILRKSAVLYIPLLLMYLFLNLMWPGIEPGKKKYLIRVKSPEFVLFILCVIACTGSFINTLLLNKSYYESFFTASLHLDGGFIVGLVVAAPAAAAAFAVIRVAAKNKFHAVILNTFIYAPISLFLLFRGNYTSHWIPFVLLSAYMLVFYSIRQRSQIMLSAINSIGELLKKHSFVFIMILMATAALSDTSSPYMAVFAKSIFRNIPF